MWALRTLRAQRCHPLRMHRLTLPPLFPALLLPSQSITALTAGQQVPVISLIPPAQTQCTALAYLDNSTAAYCVL